MPTLARGLIFLLCVSSLNAHRLPIRTYTTADGLARDRINCIHQDSRGFLWFCTVEGLSRFDGYRFTNYHTEQGLPHNVVTDMLETADGVYWVGTLAGLCRFDPAAQDAVKFQRQVLPGNSQEISVLLKDRQGGVWAGTKDGLFYLRPRASGFEPVDLATAEPSRSTPYPAYWRSRGILALMEDRRGALWVSTLGGLFRRDPDGHTRSFQTWFHNQTKRNNILTMLEDRDGRIWFGGDGQVWRLEGTSPPTAYLPARVRVFSLLQSSAGTIWIGTSDGLTKWVPRARGTEREFESYDVNNGLSGNEADVVFEDRDRNLWIGTDGGGVMRLTPGGFVTFYAEDGLAGQRTGTGSLFETRQGELCFLQQSVVGRFDGRRFQSTRLRYPSEIQYFGWGTGRLALHDRSGEWWMATGQGLARFPAVPFDRLSSVAPKAIYRTAEGLPGDNIFQLFEDSRGDIWIGVVNSPPEDGVAVFERKTGRIRAVSRGQGIPLAPTGFAEDRAGNVWIGFYEGELARFCNGRLSFLQASKGVPGGGWKVPYMDSSGRLWVAARRGLGRADDPTAEQPRFVTYTTQHGLASNSVIGITEDRWGNLYVATGRGVDRVKPLPEGIAVTRHYTYADGLAAGELSSAYRDRNGDLWFVTNRGISRLTPTADPPPGAPPVMVTGIQIGAAAQPIADVGQAAIEGLRIPPGQGLRIDFVGLSFAPGEVLRYQYQLEGVDRDWSVPAEERTVVYARLASGGYRFRVRAVNSEGMPSPVPATVSFRMLPPIWLTWWFLSAVTLGVATVFLAAHRYRVRQLLAVERVRARIATDLHDDIGSSLSQISILNELVRQRLNTGDPSVNQPLAEIATISGETVASLSDIVWAVNPRHDRLGDLSARMRRFAFDVLGARGIEVSFQTQGEQAHLRTSSNFRREVYLIFKEAVNNCGRHAECTLANVDLRVDRGLLMLRVHDNGAGFDSLSAANGDGLVNMRRRAVNLGGQLAVQSEPGLGTDVILSVRLPASRTL